MLDRSSRTNRPDEHRPWCRYRKAPDEHTRTVALTRTLRTQGLVIRLPLSVTLGDRFAVPSLAAALLLGLHEQIGGSPDHLQIAHVTDPAPGRARRCLARRCCCTTWCPAAPATSPSSPTRRGVGPALPGLGPGPRLPVPGRAAAGLPPLPAAVRRALADRQRLPGRRASGTCAPS